MHTPLSLSLIHALDFCLRYDLLLKNYNSKTDMVLFDRYIYTALVRDTIRGINSKLVYDLYRNVRKPDIIFYLKIEPKAALERMGDISKRTDYILGLDIHNAINKRSAFLSYLEYQNDKYTSLFSNIDNCYFIDGNKSEEEQHYEITTILEEKLKYIDLFGE